MKDVGIVCIGRNEGERLRRCLASVRDLGAAVVYVDSNSSDDSVEIARAAGIDVVTLSPAGMLNAARARNEGVSRLGQIAAGVQLVQFLDGDCELAAGWIDRAVAELRRAAEVAVVCGRRRERTPEASPYHRAAEVEWNTPLGEVKSCGGDAMMRIDAFRTAGGFDESLIAGEEPELCQRLRRGGFRALRLDAEMSSHDSGELTFAKWWRRAVRSGYGALDVDRRFGGDLFHRQVRSARLWAVGWPLLMLVTLLIGLAGDSAASMVPAMLAFLLLPLQMIRVAFGVRGRSPSWRTAMSYGILTMIGKWPQWIGQRRCRRDRNGGATGRLIEYKS